MSTLAVTSLNASSEEAVREGTTRTAHARFAEQAAFSPSAAAIRCGAEVLSYGELNRRANQLAHRLLRSGVQPGDRVSLCVERGTGMAVGALAILKTGAAYVPVDPAYPAERIGFVLRDAAVRFVVAQQSVQNRLAIYDRTVVLLEDDVSGESALDPAIEIPASSAAYVIYTSGSTGAPKGVVITHGNLGHYLEALTGTLGIRADDVYLHTASIGFSSSVRQLFMPLGTGACVVVARPELTENPAGLFGEIQRRGVTVIDLVPSYWRVCTQVLRALPAAERSALLANQLRLVLSASEPLPTDVVQEWRAGLGMQTQFINMFGQTETTGIVSTYPIPDDLAGLGSIVPIGRPLPSTELHVLTTTGEPAAAGEAGEVFIGGPGVGAGYLNQPGLTAERFVDHPALPGERVYRTGDRGRLRADGAFEFVGRGDDQVKIRGFRVELFEVEAALRSYPAIREAAVRARPDASGDARLVAVLVLNPGVVPSAALLRRHLQRNLPDYMIPSQFAVVAQLPRTATGKLDRQAIAQAETSAALLGSTEYVAPRTETERQVASIWAELLEIPRVGVRDHFLELGGHSLMGHRVAVRIRQLLGVDLPLRDLLEAATVEELAARVEGARSPEAGAGAAPLVVRARGAELPLSNAQQRLWLLAQMHPESTAYNLSAGLRLRGALDLPVLQRALTEVVRRHESLRTIFPERNGTPVQVILPPPPVNVPVVTLEGDVSDGALIAAAEREVRTVFDLATGPLFRALVLQAGADDHLLVLSMHHIVSDGWSRGLLYREIAALYGSFAEDGTTHLPELAIQYADVAEWQRQWLESGALEPQLGYWKEQLAGALPVLDLPTDRSRPAVQSTTGATLRFTLPELLADQVRAVGAGEQATLFMTLLAAYQTLLYRYSGQTDVVVGSPVAGRRHIESEALIGFFVNTLVLRSDLSGAPTFRQLLGRVREMAHAAYQNQDVPFDRLVEELDVARDLSRSPLFQTMFILQNTPTRPVRLRGLDLEHVELDAGAAKFDLTLSLAVDDSGLIGSLEYSTDLFDRGTVERLADHYRTLLENIVANPDATIDTLGFLTEAEQKTLVHELNDTATAVAADACVHQLFERQVERTPDATAVVFEASALTYRQLNERANQLAHYLMSLGLGPDSLVGICVPRSLDMMVALLAIQKAGAAYVPLDPSYPRERLAVMIEDAAVPVLLTTETLASQVPQGDARLVLVDGDEANSGRTDNPQSAVAAHNLAYVIYTSGSTGKPKGVMVEHRNVVNFFAGMDERLGTQPGTWLAVTSISFDISVLELFWTLTRGYKVVIQSEEGVLSGGAVQSVAASKTIDYGLFYFASNEQANTHDKYRILLEGARFADANGFTSVWTPERHFHAFGGLYPNPSVTSAAIAAITKNVSIRAGSVVLPLHHPLRIAEEWSVVDNLSNGRVGLAFASGWHDRDFVFAPQNYADRRDIMTRGIETVRALWRGESMKAVTGAGKETDVKILPRPVQKELPIWITAAGTPETYRSAGQMGANVLTHLLGQSIDQLREKIEIYRQARAEAGHEGDGIVSLMMHTFIGDDLEEVRARVYHPFREYLRTSVALIKELAEGRGQDLRSSSFTPADMEALLDYAFERYWQSSALLGTVDSCMEVVDQLKAIGVNEVACLIDFGIEDDAVLASLDGLLELKQRSQTRTVLADDDFSVAAQVVRHQISHLQCTPSLAAILLSQQGSRQAFRSLRTIMVGGEAFPPALAAELRRVTPARLLNMYGPTETTIWSSTSAVTGKESTIPLGPPIANTQFYVLDAAGQNVPFGVPGELYIGGTSVVRGYLNRAELTAERFLADRFRGQGRLYRTGDLVRYRADRQLEFLGRTDHQVKVHGHRIELGEIEATLAARPEVRECVVAAREDGAGDKRLVAYVVAKANSTIDVNKLRETARATLPEFMVPAQFVVLPDLPRTPNNKVDRKALPEPALVAIKLPLAEYAAPASELERRIAAVWQDILRLPQVGSNDNFFDLGGNSFLAVRVLAALRSALERDFSLTTLFRFPTVGALAAHLTGGAAAQEAPSAQAGADRAEMRRQALNRRRQRQ